VPSFSDLRVTKAVTISVRERLKMFLIRLDNDKSTCADMYTILMQHITVYDISTTEYVVLFPGFYIIFKNRSQ